MVSTSSSYVLLIHHLKKNTEEYVLPNELQNGSDSSKEVKEPN
jgi:hypothetical protein